MTPVKKLTLLEQRRILRQQLHVQRQSIAQQTDSKTETDSNYPRSMTMRFLTGKSPLGSKLIMNATALLGMSVAKSLVVSLFMSKFVKRKLG